jgi:hypothetical protein
MAQSNIYEIVNCFLNKLKYECCICNEKAKEFYIICKPGCVSYSYCKICIENIRTRRRCPFTNIIFDNKDICLDHKTNKDIDENIKIFEKLKYILGKSIKTISINIETT